MAAYCGSVCILPEKTSILRRPIQKDSFFAYRQKSFSVFGIVTEKHLDASVRFFTFPDLDLTWCRSKHIFLTIGLAECYIRGDFPNQVSR